MNANFHVRCMEREDLNLIAQWANAEGWNPGRFDGDAFFAADAEGFFVGEWNDEPVSCISCVRYGDSFGFLGQYIVWPEHRGSGYGMQTWIAGMAHLGNRNVGLDGVLSQQSNYAKSGFRFAHHNTRYEGRGGGRVPAGVTPLSAIPIEIVLTYDAELFAAPREAFLRQWLRIPESAAFGVVRDGRFAGYGVIRPSADGYKIGPLFADDDAAARDLFQALAACAEGKAICLDAPDDTVNAGAGRLVREFDLKPIFTTARMYTRGQPAMPMHKVYGITTMELG